MIRACLFDMDGTLFDTIEAIRAPLNRVLLSFGLSPITPEETKRFVGNGARKIVERAFGASGCTSEEKIAEGLSAYNAAYDADPYSGCTVYPGIAAALGEIRALGLKIAVITNKPQPTADKLAAALLPGLCDLVLGGREGIPLKPAPDAPLEACRALGASPSETLYFGDTSTDIETAKNYRAGTSVGVLWGFRDRKELLRAGADVLLETPDAIAPFVRERVKLSN